MGVKKVMNGAEAMATAYKLAGVKIAYTYPITPQSEVIEYLASQGGIICIEADSEYNVLAGSEGVTWSGERCAVVTSSQGLIYASELLWEISGNRLPMVMGIFNRALKGPGWNVGAQQNDSLFMRDTGWIQLYCESVQELLDMILISFKLAESVLLPAMVIGDGFYLSHVTEEVEIPSRDEVLAFLGEPSFAEELPKGGRVAGYGPMVAPDRYFDYWILMHSGMEEASSKFKEVAKDYENRFGRGYGLVDCFMMEDAVIAIVSAGVICGVAKEAVISLRERGVKAGVLKIRSFRPFPKEEIRGALSNVGKVVVLDRNIAPGIGGILAWELASALFGMKGKVDIYGFVTGLGGLDVTTEMVEEAVSFSLSNGPTDHPIFLEEGGIRCLG
jgi:pyruvate/2-oxoacid:ferredoxin oxidoreductase alpha subunit